VLQVNRNSPQLDPAVRVPGNDSPDEPAGSDWKNNWVSKIAIKITAPVLWFLVFIGTAVSFLLSGDIDTKVRSELDNQANHYAYALSRMLDTDRESLAHAGERIIKGDADRFPFTAVQIQLGNKSWNFGKAASGDERLTRPLLGSAAANSDYGKIGFHHPPVRQLVKRERVRLLISAGVPLLLLGIALSALVNFVVVGPIQNLVQATRRVSDGDLSLRLNSKRQDEFGHLERFFDDMLDKLQEQNDQIQAALESAQAADRTKSQFLANMSHELRTPLNAIIGYAELMMESLGDQKERRGNYQEDLERIRASGKHLLTLINDVLDIAKIEAGKMEIYTSSFPVRDMIRDIEATAMPLIGRNNNQSEFLCPDDIGNMESDQLRVRQVLLNLLSNAAKFTHDGSIKLVVERYRANGGDWVRFKVEDNGVGIDELDSKRLFSEFAQVEDHINGKPVGTGLGLAISRKFCELMGGSIRLESKPGIGSVFYVELPAALS